MKTSMFNLRLLPFAISAAVVFALEYLLPMVLPGLSRLAEVLVTVLFCCIAIPLTLRRSTAALEIARQQTRAAIRESAALQCTLDEFAIVSVANAAGRITKVNDTFCRISGYSRQELLGQDHRLLNSGYHPKAFWVEAWRTVAAGKTWRGEVCNRAKDGSLYWVDSIIAPFRGDDGKIEKYISIRKDITQTKRDKEALLASSDRLRFALDAIETGDWELNLDDHSAHRSLKHDQIFGYTTLLPNWTYEIFLEHVIPEDRALVDQKFQHAASTTTDWKFECRILRCDGVQRWIFASGRHRFDSQGGQHRMAGVVQDITERKNAEQKIADSEARFRTLVEGTEIIVWESDPQTHTFTYVSPQAAKLGHPLAEWYTPGFWARHIHPDDRERVVSNCHDKESAGHSDRLQYRMLTADGRAIWVEHVVSTERLSPGPDGKERWLERGVLIDIGQLREAKEAAEAASRAKSQFLANMSHEIRTPLTAILGYAEILREVADSPSASETRARTLDTICVAGQHLMSIINNILDLSKVEAGGMIVERIDTSLIGVLNEVESLVRPKAMEKGLSLQVRIQAPVPQHIISDPTCLRQILMNLAANAVKFTESGYVTITVSAVSIDQCSRLQFDVLDTGAGMSAEQASHIFSPFTQADSSMARKHGGTGLGLTISRKLAELMHGNVILVRSEPGSGSLFRLELPLEAMPDTAMASALDRHPDDQKIAQQSECVPAAQASSPATITQLSGRILYAEDSPDNQRLVAFHLKKAGASIEIADNGLIALGMLNDAAARGTPFDILLTDMQMPEMDGYTLARTLRSQNNSIPIVALTAHAMADDRDKCFEAGCDDYATKPINKASLLKTCSVWLSESTHRRAA